MEAEEIKRLRKRLKLTQLKLADKLGVTRATVINWEHRLAKPSRLARRQLDRLERG